MYVRALSLAVFVFVSTTVFAAKAATFKVTTTADSGAGSLRQAIIDANATAGADVIDFNIAPAGEKTITLANLSGALPAITEPVTIDGTTQPGFSSKAVIELNGASVLTAVDGLRITTSNCVVRGLVINRFRSDGIEINGGGNNVVEGCIIGLNLAGTTDSGNTFNGILISNSSSNRIGGATVAARNIISGNDDSGVRIDGAGSTGNVVAGNFLGLDINGTTSRGNTDHGVHINGAVNTNIGGSTDAERNIISGNGQVGVLIEGAGAAGNVVSRNYIGADVTGTLDLGNSVDGIRINLVGNNTIGGVAGGNLISGNNNDGIEITGATAAENRIFGNTIGLNAAGAALANSQHGIHINANASGNYIGAEAPGGPNTIAFNSQDGVYVASGTNNTIRANSTYSNGGLGIDLDPNSGTANDVGDVDVGANNRQNFPVVTSAAVSATETTITGTLNSAANATFTVDFYSVVTPDASGGEGQQHLGSTIVTTDAAGNVSFTSTTGVAAIGRYVTATATDDFGNTSEFSPNANVASTVAGATFTVTTTADSGAGSLRQAILDANASAGVSTIAFNIPGDGPHTITNLTSLPAVTNTVVIDGYTQPGAVANTDVSGFNGVLKIILIRGTAAPSFDGLSLQWPGSVVRGLNIIGMGSDGIEIGTVAPGCVVEGCVIGMELSSTARANSGAGININNSYANRVGGTTPAARNVISGNNNAGVLLEGAGANGNTVVGNYIGLTLSGLAKVANGQDGVRINGGSNNTIGGTAAGARNVIAGNNQDGVEISAATATNNVVQGNYIGTDVAGATALGNAAYGVSLFSSRNSAIGGVAAGAANVIAFNTLDGVYVNSGTNNAVRANAIHSNGGLGIDLEPNNLNPNDIGDGDPTVGQNTANLRQNFPVITSALAHAAATDIGGTLNSGTNITYALDFYANAAADPLGNGEGQQYLGSTTVTTDGDGNATFNLTFPVGATGKFICATATDPFGNTSELGPCFAASSDVPGQTFAVTTTADAGPGSLRQAILDADGLFNAGDTIAFNIPGEGPHTILVASALPAITDVVTIDGYTQPGATANTSAAEFNGALKIIVSGAAVGTTIDGFSVQWPGVTIRGLNIISFRNDGIEFNQFGSNGVVEGCVIGLGLDGSDLGNNQNGVLINGAANVRVGGSTAGARNVISGNTRHGVEITGANAANNRVLGNLIGTGLDGVARVGNTDGVNINTGAHDNTVGGATEGERNVLSGNASEGVEIIGNATANNVVIGNYIGTDSSGAGASLNQGSGVLIQSARDSRVGGTNAGEGNRIAFNNGDGVTINVSTNNTVRGNAIFSNGDIGIDLANNSVTANDAGDVDVGPNHLQNTPVLTGATANSSNTSIRGTLNSRADTTYQIDFFSSLQFAATGVYEAEKYLGSVSVTTDASGNTSFDVTVNGVVNGRFITATATDPNGNTSELSPAIRAESTIAPPTLVVTTAADAGAGSLRQALLDAGNYVVGAPVNINFNIPGDGPHFIYPVTALPTPSEPIFLNGFSQAGASANTLAQGNNALLKINLSGSNVNFAAGLRLTNSGNIIRGLAIMQFGQNGIEINGDSNRVEGCFIGLDSAGVARGNSPAGVRITPLNPFGNATGGTNNVIGGNTPAARNVIAGNNTHIWLEYGGSSNVIQGNYIGTNPGGTEGYPNFVSAGVYISSVPDTIIGGAGTGEGNLISGNNGRGIIITDGTSVGTRVLGNRIGTDVTGALGLPNTTGIEINNNASDTVIGGVNPGEANLIAFNNGHGVAITSGTNNAARANIIHSNTALAIGLGFDGVTENDADDVDSGANDLQNFPVITSAHGTASDTTIAGTLDSLPNRTYALDFYANILGDPTGYGEAEQYLGSVNVTTDADGNGAFNITLPAVINGRFISATATDPDGNTSELSRNFEATTTFPAETFVVTNTNDSGPGSLRQAIRDNNRSRAGVNNVISFKIPGDGPHTITPLTALDTPRHAVTIDGFTQPGTSANTLAVGNNSVLKIRIDGNNTFVPGLTIGARNSIVRGLSITRCGSAVIIEAPGVQVAGCWIGVAPDGTAAGNQSFGINLTSGSDVVIGGTTPAERNVISATGSYGILTMAGTSGARIQGNYIGTSPAGTSAMGNGTAGILLSGSSHTVGGAVAGARNVISGNPQGMTLNVSTNSIIEGNYIGVDATGAASFNTTGAGIDFGTGSRDNVIRGNVISGNGYFGITIFNTGSTGNRIVGNLIGTDATGTAAVRNANAGIGISVSGNEVGGADEADGNVIAFNGQQGVSVFSSTTGTLIRKNRIFRNSQLGIDLSADGVTANDATDADIGPNQLQNYPVITAATIGVSDVQITGYLQSAANQAFEVDFFASAVADPTGNGEGEQYLGSAVVNTGVDGRGDFAVTFTRVANGRFITATATDSQNNSSEFSGAFRAVSTRPLQTLVVTTDADSGPGSLRQALIDAGSIFTSGANRIHFNIPGGGLRVIQVLSQLPTPAEPVEIDAFTQPGAAPNAEADRDGAVRLVELRGLGLLSFEDGLRLNTSGNLVRGLIVSQFPGNGIVLSNADNSIIEGSLVLSNGSSGVVINNSIGGLVGGAAPQKRNTISGNVSSGVLVTTAQPPSRAADNRILGNFIGADLTGGGSYRAQNQGVYISAGARTQVGGTGAGEGNWIAFNSRGVVVQTSSENRIVGNRIYSNNSLGIDLGFNGLTQNDAGDGDGGANNLQNFPVVQTANITANGTRFAGTLNSIANSNFTIDFYSSDACDANGFGEGARYIGQTALSTDASGNGSFDVVLPLAVPRGVVTATATDAAGNTSEFSACAAVGTEIPPQNFIVTTVNDSGPGSLRQAILDANAAFTTGRNTISFNIAGAGVKIISPAIPLPDVSGVVAIDGLTQPGSQPNTSPTETVNAVLLIRLDGAAAGAGADGLRITGDGCLVRGLIITRFDGAGIRVINADNVTLTENIIGVVDPALPIAPALSNKKGNVAGTEFEFANGIGIAGQGGTGSIIGLDNPEGFIIVAENRQAGIRLDQTQQTIVQNATVEGNGLMDNPSSGGGVEAVNTTGLTVRNNRFADNCPADCQVRRGTSGSSRGTRHERNKHRKKRGSRRGHHFVADRASVDEVSNNTMFDADGSSIIIRSNDSGGRQDILNNTITGAREAGILIENGLFNTVGGFSPGQENTLVKNGAGILVLGGSGNCLVNNVIGLDDLTLQEPPPSRAPTLQPPTVRNAGAETVLTVTGVTRPNEPVFLEPFRIDFFDPETPVIEPAAPGVTVNSDANGNFTTEFVFTANPNAPPMFGAMGASAFGDTSQIVFVQPVSPLGNITVDLEGPNTVLLGTTETFTLSFSYSQNAVTPYATFTAPVRIPPGFELAGISSPPGHDVVAIDLTAEEKILALQSSLQPGETRSYTVTLRAVELGAFTLTLDPYLTSGDNFNRDDDNDVISGTVITLSSGIDVLAALQGSENVLESPAERALANVLYSNMGSTPATGGKVIINPGPDGIVFPPSMPVEGVMLNFDPAQNTISGLPPITHDNPFQLPLNIWFRAPGEKTVTLNFQHDGADQNPANNIVTWNLTVNSVARDPADYGDAPDSFGTTAAANGVWHLHVVGDPILGPTVGSEPDGLPSPLANADPSDDGVIFGPLVAGQVGTATFNLSGPGMIDFFADWNRDGVFSQWSPPGAPQEYLSPFVEGNPNPLFGFGSLPVQSGPNEARFPVPAGVDYSQPVNFRVRVSKDGKLTFLAGTIGGEVEDHQARVHDTDTRVGVLIAPNPNPSIGQMTFVTIPVQNAGSTPATDVKFTVNPGPNGVVVWPADNDIFTFDPSFGGGVFVDPIDPNQTREATVGLYFTSSGAKTVQVHVDQAEPQTNSSNNDGSTTFDVRTEPPPPFDMGDAPDTYKTTKLAGGPKHGIVAGGPRLGAGIDADPDGAPTIFADGDDLDPDGDDEDGVRFTDGLVAGAEVRIRIIASGPCYLDAWIDYDGDNMFNVSREIDEPHEYISGDFVESAAPVNGEAVSHLLNAGINDLRLRVPNNRYVARNTMARFRVSAAGNLTPFGDAPDGEVEDYMVQLFDAHPDFGDAPDSDAVPGYPTLLTHNGAYHVTDEAGFNLGTRIDYETDGLPSTVALGDDQDNGLEFPQSDDPDDEDGVIFQGALIRGQMVTVNVFVEMPTPGPAKIDAWIDFNQDKDWSDAGEQIFKITDVIAGNNTLQFTVPATATLGNTYARFRLSRNGNVALFGKVVGGEVEDYMVEITDQTVTPTLRYSINTAGSLVLDFTGFLDSAPAVTGPWTRRATQSPFTVDPRVGMMFFRASSE